MWIFRALYGSPKIEPLLWSHSNEQVECQTFCWNEWGLEERPPKELVCVLARSKMNYLPVSTYICIMQIEFLAWILLLLLTTKPFITLHAFSNNYYSGIAKFLTESILVIDFIYTYVLIFGMNEWMLNTESFNFSVLWWPEPISQPDADKKHVSINILGQDIFIKIFWHCTIQ